MTAPRIASGQNGEEGFALLAAIWFVALMALVAIIVSGWMSRSLGLATRLQDRLEAHAAMIDAENQIAYRMVTGFFSARGLEIPTGDELADALSLESSFGHDFKADTHYIALDDRPYRLGTMVVRVQDDRGLYTLNHPSPLAFGNLLRGYGINYNDRGVLLDRLLDYMEKSGLHRLNGATALDYQQSGRPAPRGAPLLTPWEAMRVLSWDDHPALWRGPNALPTLTTIGDAVQLNPDTAPKLILESLPGMDEHAAERVIEYRQRYVIQNQVDLAQAAGVTIPVDPMALMFFPSDSLDVAIESVTEPLSRRMRLHLTGAAKAPYRIDYVVGLPADGDSRALATQGGPPPEFPEFDKRSATAGDPKPMPPG